MKVMLSKTVEITDAMREHMAQPGEKMISHKNAKAYLNEMVDQIVAEIAADAANIDERKRQEEVASLEAKLAELKQAEAETEPVAV